MMMSVFQQMRQADDTFSQQIYQTTRLAFSRNLRTALEARESWYKEKLKANRLKHEQQLQAVRAAASVEVAQRTTQMRIAVARVLAKNPAARMDPSAASEALQAIGALCCETARLGPWAALPVPYGVRSSCICAAGTSAECHRSQHPQDEAAD
jgi:hypothetical protein